MHCDSMYRGSENMASKCYKAGPHPLLSDTVMSHPTSRLSSAGLISHVFVQQTVKRRVLLLTVSMFLYKKLVVAQGVRKMLVRQSLGKQHSWLSHVYCVSCFLNWISYIDLFWVSLFLTIFMKKWCIKKWCNRNHFFGDILCLLREMYGIFYLQTLFSVKLS